MPASQKTNGQRFDQKNAHPKNTHPKGQKPEQKSGLADARATALAVFAGVLADKGGCQAVLDRHLDASGLAGPDRRLCASLVYGTLRQKIRLRWFLERFLKNPDKLPQEMILALEMALYALFFLRIPPHATLDWTVEYVKRKFGKSLAGVTNGVLRSIQRSNTEFFNQEIYTRSFSDRYEALACFHAMPVWIFMIWINSYGEETALQYLAASQNEAPVGIRVNRCHAGAEDLFQKLLPEADRSIGSHALAFSSRIPLAAEEALVQGAAARQSLASYEVLDALTPQTWPQPVWDCCTGRGGKALALLEMGVPVALVSDTAEHRIIGYRHDAGRLGFGATAPPALVRGVEDTSSFAKKGARSEEAHHLAMPESFGTVLVDAPCSGFGTLARHPEIRLRRTEKDLAELVLLQKKILRAAAKRVRPGGYIIYITCTLNPAENEEQVATFLKDHAGSRVVSTFQTPADSTLYEFFYGVRIALAE